MKSLPCATNGTDKIKFLYITPPHKDRILEGPTQSTNWWYREILVEGDIFGDREEIQQRKGIYQFYMILRGSRRRK